MQPAAASNSATRASRPASRDASRAKAAPVAKRTLQSEMVFGRTRQRTRIRARALAQPRSRVFRGRRSIGPVGSGLENQLNVPNVGTRHANDVKSIFQT